MLKVLRLNFTALKSYNHFNLVWRRDGNQESNNQVRSYQADYKPKNYLLGL